MSVGVKGVPTSSQEEEESGPCPPSSWTWKGEVASSGQGQVFCNAAYGKSHPCETRMASQMERPLSKTPVTGHEELYGIKYKTRLILPGGGRPDPGVGEKEKA